MRLTDTHKAMRIWAGERFTPAINPDAITDIWLFPRSSPGHECCGYGGENWLELEVRYKKKDGSIGRLETDIHHALNLLELP